jgi:uncharacterized oxidoreductase
MELKNNTVLITGGSSGIGLELAIKLAGEQNKVIICSRSSEKLSQAKNQCPELITYQCDISKIEDCHSMSKWINEHHPECNILVNNAAIVHKANFSENPDMIAEARAEIETNLLAPISLAKLFIPILEKNRSPWIINITTGLVYAPRAAYPVYNATKAALHSFTQVLRLQLKETKIHVVEVQFPAVDTPWHNGNPPHIAIGVERAVHEMYEGLKAGKEVIRIAAVKKLYLLSRLAPGFALKKVNSI